MFVFTKSEVNIWLCSETVTSVNVTQTRWGEMLAFGKQIEKFGESVRSLRSHTTNFATNLLLIVWMAAKTNRKRIACLQLNLYNFKMFTLQSYPLSCHRCQGNTTTFFNIHLHVHVTMRIFSWREPGQPPYKNEAHHAMCSPRTSLCRKWTNAVSGCTLLSKTH